MSNRTPDRILAAVAAIAVAVFCVRTFSDNKADVDLWGNVGFVTALPWQDAYHYINMFSFTEPDHPWVNHEWLAEYALNRAFVLGGNTGLLGLKLLLAALVLLLANEEMRRACPSGAARTLFLVLIISAMGYGASTRPHLFTYLMLALFLLVLRRWEGRAVPMLLVLPALGWAWTNLHGAFFIGLVLLLVHGVLRGAGGALRRDRAALRCALLAVSGGAIFLGLTFLNPYGRHLWDFIFASGATPRPYLSEWAVLHPLRDFFSHVDFMVLALLSVLAVVLSRRQRDPARTGLFVLALAAAVLMRRNIPLFALVAAFTVPEHVQEVAGEHLDRLAGRIPRTILVVVLGLFAAVTAGYAVRFEKTDALEVEVRQDRFAVGAVRFLQANGVKGNLLAFFDWAEYAIWHLYPGCRVFLDGRFLSAYSAECVETYFRFLYAEPGWAAALEEYPTDIVLLHRFNPATEKMLQRDGWALVYADEIACVFLKEDAHAETVRRAREGLCVAPEVRPAVFFP